MSDDPHSLEICPTDGQELDKGQEVDEVDKLYSNNLVTKHLRQVMTIAAGKIYSMLLREMQSCEECRIRHTFPRWLPSAMKMGGLKLVESVTSEGHKHSIFVLENANDEDHRGMVPQGTTNTSSSINISSSSNNHTNTSISSGLVDLNVLAGRLRKFMGDVCLQLCAPVDAIAHYAAAAVAYKTVSDPLWHAGALEGYAAAVLILLDQSPTATFLHDTLGQVTPSLYSFVICTLTR